MVSAALLAAAAFLSADERSSKRDADLLKQKVATITAFGGRPSNQIRRTPVNTPCDWSLGVDGVFTR